MRSHSWLLSIVSLSVCFAAVAAFSAGCTQRRSEGQKPSAESVQENEVKQGQEQAVRVGSDEHVPPQQRFPGGVEPSDHKAQKLVNQLFNYCVGICGKQLACPDDLETAQKAVKEEYKLFWPKDPWGNPYQYKKIDDMHCDVWSLGPDGQDGTEDDIHVADSNRENLPG